MMQDFKLCAESGDHSIIDIGTIIHNDSFYNTVLTDKVMLMNRATTFLVREAKEAASTHFV